jgi:hypothetical protein
MSKLILFLLFIAYSIVGLVIVRKANNKYREYSVGKSNDEIRAYRKEMSFKVFIYSFLAVVVFVVLSRIAYFIFDK